MKEGDSEKNKQIRKLQERIEELGIENEELKEGNKRKQQSLNGICLSRVLHPHRRGY